jgi:hypothetical protein
LGGRRPSDLLAAMYEYCPAGEETSELFKALFLTRLPPEIRVLLEPGEFTGLKQLATKEDQLWLTLATKQFAAVVQQDSLQTDEEAKPVASVSGRRFKHKPKAKAAPEQSNQAAPVQQSGGVSGGNAGGKKSVSLMICWKHAKFGSKAFSCADSGSCQWPEN